MSKQNKSDNMFSLRWAKKIKAVRMLGNKCMKCNNNNIFQLEFHHTEDNKEINVGSLLSHRWSIIEPEMRKCVILCANCHAELHYTRQNILKEKLLDIKGQKKCIECGYNKSCGALEFHHINGEDKDFGIARGYRDDRWKIPLKDIIIEMDKCNVVCRNCHLIKKIDTNRFEYLRNKIYSKIEGHSELNRPADRDLIVKLLKMGHGVCRIAREMGYSKSTISLIKNKKTT